jgi:hypothetical protein
VSTPLYPPPPFDSESAAAQVSHRLTGLRRQLMRVESTAWPGVIVYGGEWRA